MKDNYIIGRFYVPMGIIIILTVMIYFHRHHLLKYLYLINIFFFLAAISSYFIVIKHPAGKEFPKLWMNTIPFVWLARIFGGYFLSVLSFSAFVIEHARRHIWAKARIVLAGVMFVLLCMVCTYLFIKGILSLKSGWCFIERFLLLTPLKRGVML